MAKYKFILSNGVQTREALPNWKSDLAKEWAFEQNQMFRRASLTDSLVFMNADYDWIMAQGFEVKILITVNVSWNDDSSYVEYWKGSFHKTDCTINLDDKTIKVKPEVEDKYTKILAKLDNEYDLMKLVPPNQPVHLQRRPLFQVYAAGESVVSCFLGGMAWEQDVVMTDMTDEELQDDCHFGHCADIIRLTFDNAPAGLTTGFYGMWEHGTAQGAWEDFASDEGVYYMSYYQSAVLKGLRIYAVGGSNALWEYQTSNVYDPFPDTFTMSPLQSGLSALNASWSSTAVYARWLLGREFSDSSEIAPGDLVANNRNYRYCYPYIHNDSIRMTSRFTSEPTKWGIRPDGNYYLKPQLSADEVFLSRGLYPIARSTWNYGSVWLDWSESLAYTEESFRTDMTLRDAYTLEAVISVLLAEIDASLTFAATSAYSTFLYGTNPLTSSWGRLVMTPKSNILKAEYTQPAQTAPITLGEVLTMLQKACGCYWYIDQSNRLRIEHVSYFKNGMSYSGTPSVGLNVPSLYNSRHGHSWALGTGEYSYDKIQMPQRYEYSWMDDTTDAFKGDAIEVMSTFVQEGNIEDITIAKFNSDIDYIMLNPSDVSEDGFALMCCLVSGSGFYLPYITRPIDENEVTLQNYLLAMVYLQPAFLISDMPSWNIKVNGEAATAKGIQRMKKQQLKVPVGIGDGDLEQLVRTTVGDGEVERMTVNLLSRTAKYQLRFDTTERPT